jgi:hypothetical protein
MRSVKDLRANTSAKTEDAFYGSTKKWALGFARYLGVEGASARPALERLLNAGCNKVILIELLSASIALRENRNHFRKEAQMVSQSAKYLARDMRSLAARLRQALYLLPDRELAVQPDDPDRKKIRLSPEFAEHVAPILDAYAAFVTTRWQKQKFIRAIYASEIYLPLLAAYVRIFSGHTHYPELSALLDAAEDFDNKGALNPRCPDALRKQIDRYRTKRRAYARHLDRLIRDYRKQFGHTQTGLHFLDWIEDREFEGFPLIQNDGS